MEGIIPNLSASAKDHLRRQLRSCVDAGLRTRYLVIVNLAEGRTPKEIQSLCHVSHSTVYRIAQRFREAGEAGLVDRREENGVRKLDEVYLGTLYEVVESSPQDHGWRRPTWTREMLVLTMWRRTGVQISVARMSVALQMIGARRGRPKPTVECPWPEAEKQQRLCEIQQLIENLPPDEVAVFEDEIDIHLNPKIGLDWMVPGQQKEVVTPGKNEKQYMAGAQDARTGELIWIAGEKKNTHLFILMLWQLVQHYKTAKTIHVILDNFSIHSTKQVEVTLATEAGQRIRLHFLPPYCPDHNKIERTWQDLHANVTRNHNHAELHGLMNDVLTYLRIRNRKILRNQQPSTAA